MAGINAALTLMAEHGRMPPGERIDFLGEAFMGLAFRPSPPLTPEFPGEIPFAMTSSGEADLATAMADYLRNARPGSGAEALRALRRAFPDSPLTLRVAALDALMRR